jgi:hypothetical protein
MYVDSQVEFSDAQALTVSAISQNVYDTLTVKKGGNPAPDISPNIRLDHGTGVDHSYLVVSTPVAITDAGNDATLTVELVSADDEALTAGVVVHFSSGALAFGAFSAAGQVIAMAKMPIGLYKRYIGVRYTVGAGPLLTGAVDAFITTDVQFNRIYKSAINVQ